MPIWKSMERAGALAAAGFLLAPGGAGGQVSVTCLGDSVTHGYPYAESGHPELAYPARLQSLLDGAYGEGAFAVLNRGVNGYQAEDLVGDLLEPNALAENPAYVLLMIGGNDLAGAEESTIVQIVAETTWEVQSCVDLARAHLNPDGSRPKVIVSAFIPNRLEGALGSLAVGYFNASLAAHLSGYDLWFTANWDDLYDPATGMAKAGLMYDDVHPNGDGYAELGQNWREALAVLIPSPTAAPPTAAPATPSVPPASPTPSPAPTPARRVYDAADFDGDGADDPGLWRPANSTFYIYAVSAVAYGTAGDVPVTGDYNGDGTADYGVFRPATGRWWVRGIYAGADYASFLFGTNGDFPVPADYDGDFRTDTAVWRPRNGYWAIKSQTRFYYGASADLPVPADYDGDGKADPAVFRKNGARSGIWYLRHLTSRGWGYGSDAVCPGDYNGDGTAELSVFRGATGTWHVLGSPPVAFGGAGDVPVAIDFEGDGTRDRVLYRPANGTWHVYGVTSFAYGTSDDGPAVGRTD